MIVNACGKAVSPIPEIDYTGTYSYLISEDESWIITLKTSGTLTFRHLGNAENGVDIFLVGGGGNGASGTSNGWNGGAGGGSGYTTTQKNITVLSNTPYTITIAGSEGTTSALGYSAAGGSGQSGKRTGGASGGAMGTNYWNELVPTKAGVGTDGEYAFGESGFAHALGAGYKFAASGGGGSGVNAWGHGTPGAGGASGGGSGSNAWNVGGAGAANSGGGGGGGGGYTAGGAGGSGIVIIRSAR